MRSTDPLDLFEDVTYVIKRQPGPLPTECHVCVIPYPKRHLGKRLGYVHIWRAVNGERYMRHLHVIAWEQANQQVRPEGMVIRHLCDVRPCVNPEHLRLGTQAENMRDKFIPPAERA